MKIPRLILSRPKLVVDVRCPKCQSIDIAALPVVEVICKNCKTKFTTNAAINIYYSIAKKLLQLISHNNEVWILGERDVSNVFHPEDMLMPRSRHEDDVYQTILAIKHNFEDQKCYEVSEMTNENDEDFRIHCNICGTCNTCVACIKCNERYIPKLVETPHGKEKRYKCPKCGNKNYTKTYIEKVSGNCPFCESKNIKKTIFKSDRRHCPKCHTTNISKPRNIPVYKLIIKRQKRFKIPEV